MKYLVTLVFTFTFFFPAYSQVTASDPTITDFDVNGLKVIFKKRTSSPTVAVGVFFRGGTRNETAANAGIENFTLDAATEGSKKFPKEVLRTELASTGTAIDSASAYDFSAVSMVSTSENFTRSWNVLADLIMNPTFTTDDVERARNALL